MTTLVTLDTTINFYGASKAFLRFAAKWEIEQGYDYVQVMARKSSGGGWVPLEGKYTVAGSFYQDNGKPVYDGFSEWVIEEIDLEEYLYEEVQFRFLFKSDTYVTEDGFYFDDFTITVISNLTDAGQGIPVAENMLLSDAYPNPARDVFRVQYGMEFNRGAKIEVFDAMGNQVSTYRLNENNGVARLNLGGFSPGIYYYRMVNGVEVSGMKKVIKM
jgi:hypothetical protein